MRLGLEHFGPRQNNWTPKVTAEAIARRNETLMKRYGVLGFGGNSQNYAIKMIVSDWYMDTDGCMTRTIRQAE